MGQARLCGRRPSFSLPPWGGGPGWGVSASPAATSPPTRRALPPTLTLPPKGGGQRRWVGARRLAGPTLQDKAAPWRLRLLVFEPAHAAGHFGLQFPQAPHPSRATSGQPSRHRTTHGHRRHRPRDHLLRGRHPRRPGPAGRPSPCTTWMTARAGTVIAGSGLRGNRKWPTRAGAELWYKTAVVYALDVHTFQDSNGDGVGDFPGATGRLDHLADLGVTCIWLLPFFPTPDRDNGYDIADYLGVDPRYGTLDDFEAFLTGGRRARHPRVPRPRREPHLRPAPVVPGRPPGPERPGSATTTSGPTARPRRTRSTSRSSPARRTSVWTHDERAGAYYYHRFYHFQPELNTGEPGGPGRGPPDHGLLAVVPDRRVPGGRRQPHDRGQGAARDRAEGGARAS